MTITLRFKLKYLLPCIFIFVGAFSYYFSSETTSALGKMSKVSRYDLDESGRRVTKKISEMTPEEASIHLSALKDVVKNHEDDEEYEDEMDGKAEEEYVDEKEDIESQDQNEEFSKVTTPADDYLEE